MRRDLLCLAMLLALGYLQASLWTGGGGLTAVYHLRMETQRQVQENERLRRNNLRLAADVEDLKKGLEAVEELARGELMMTRDGEVFYHIIEGD